MFINHTNHLSQYWSQEQLAAAHQYGEVIDLPFPSIDPQASSAVLCQGEFVYCHALVERLLAVGITVLAATSERVVEEFSHNGINEKRVNFQFVQFREYIR